MYGDVPLMNEPRQGQVTGSWKSDATGNINVPVDLTKKTPAYDFTVNASSTGNVRTVSLLGPLKGETVHLQAQYTTPNAGTIKSNDLQFTWTKDFVPQM